MQDSDSSNGYSKLSLFFILNSKEKEENDSKETLGWYGDEGRNIRVSVWWDFENCSVPVGVSVYKVVPRILAALRTSGIKGPMTIRGYGDILQLSRSTQEALTATGICLSHVPRGFSYPPASSSQDQTPQCTFKLRCKQ
eukprot:Gb_29329 [translate_table: standard]